MTVRLYENKHLLCARWGAVTAEDLELVVARARQIEAREGRKIVYAGVQYDDTPLPDRAVSRVIIDRGMELARSCDRFCVIVAAQGIAGSLHRTGIRSMLTVARIAGANVSRVLVLDSVDAMLTELASELPGSTAQLRAALTAAGMP